MKKKQLGFMSALLAASVALAACGGNTEGNTGGDTNTGGDDTGSKKIVIATQSPLSGPQSSLGEAIKLGAEYALKLQKEEFKALGYDLELLAQDDQADPKIGVSNAESLISNEDVMGVVGHLNSGVAIPSSVKYEQGALAMVSPANTAVTLTEEGKKTVNRICARDDAQGPRAAMYAKNELGVKNVFIIHDKTSYGQGLAEQVKAQFEKDGVTVLAYEGITQGEKDYSAVLNQVVSKKPDLLYFGGIYSEGGILVKQARDKGYKGVFMGGDGLDSSEMIKIAGPDAIKGVIFTSVAGDVTQSEEGKKWAAEYEAAMGKKPETFSVYGFDSMNVLLNGIKTAIEQNGGKKPSREQVRDAVRATKDFQGQFTKVSFDDKGDNEFADVFIYKFESDKSVFIGKAE